ncbi:hypothetical protein FB451DRAFT_1555812 [Mycena latifolia]|nr:hypothetical protein FB451DRAFT_1555812 [Mycena latifolia]
MLLPPPSPRNLGSESPPTSISPSTWIPIAVVVSVLAILAVLICTRRSFRARIASMGNGVAVANGMPVTRELTAEQLAGSINRAPGAPARRTRRPRRTPSQISTVSLPAYMKEPGEQELVVSRGPDGEDVAMPAASAVDDEEEQSTEGHHRTDSQDNDMARYSPMPHPPTDSPLLGPDPRGDAPAYFEVVEPDSDSHYPPGITAAPPAPEPAAPPQQQRRSGFFSLFRPAPPAPPADPESSSALALTHTRTRSTTAPSLSPSPVPGSRHRTSPSSSTLFSLSLARQKSSTSLARTASHLTSPSAISLASISAPLPHTLVKTEFSALPRGGPTPEQLKLISGSKEGGLGRFGVPWGAAAVAYANASASTSRIALGEDGEGEAPPPGWEEVSGLPSAEASGSGSASQEAEASGSTSRTEDEPQPTPTPTLTVHPPRADSRASGVSAQSFATAEEGVSEDDGEDEDGEGGAGVSIHVQEPTDATVRPEA